MIVLLNASNYNAGMRLRESHTQQAIVKYARMLGLHCFSVPNGAHVSEKNRLRLKAEGLMPGIPDLFIAQPCAGYAGLFIEVKSARGRLSSVQEEQIDRLSKNGYMCVVVFSVADAIKAIENYRSLAE